MKFFWNNPELSQDPTKIPVIDMRMLIGIHICMIIFIGLVHWTAVSLKDF